MLLHPSASRILSHKPVNSILFICCYTKSTRICLNIHLLTAFFLYAVTPQLLNLGTTVYLLTAFFLYAVTPGEEREAFLRRLLTAFFLYAVTPQPL